MPSLEIQSFSAEHLDDATHLLAARYARQRAAESLLPVVDDVRPHLERELARDNARGLLALRGGVPVAYLIGRVEPDTGIGGERAWIDHAGVAADDAEAVRDLYAALAQDWLATGVRRHSMVVPASQQNTIDAAFRLGFGCQFMLAVRETETLRPHDAGVSIRSGTPDDLDAVASFDKLLCDLQARSPSFSGLVVPDHAGFREEWRDLWDDPETFTHFVAERDGSAVAHVVLYRRPTGDMRVPESNIDLAHAASVDEARSSGAMRALFVHALGWAHDHGFRSMTTDWRSVNLLSSRYWPRQGFRPTHLRLYRAVP